MTSHVELGNTILVLGRTQYFFGFVVLTYITSANIHMFVNIDNLFRLPLNKKKWQLKTKKRMRKRQLFDKKNENNYLESNILICLVGQLHGT